MAPTAHVGAVGWNGLRAAGPDRHGQCVKLTERKTTKALAQQGRHLKTPRQNLFAISGK